MYSASAGIAPVGTEREVGTMCGLGRRKNLIFYPKCSLSRLKCVSLVQMNTIPGRPYCRNCIIVEAFGRAINVTILTSLLPFIIYWYLYFTLVGHRPMGGKTVAPGNNLHVEHFES